jgi:hypothetical protein
MYIPKYEYCFQAVRFHYFDVVEEINSIFNGKCYMSNGKRICEPIYDIMEKDPDELRHAWDYVINHSLSFEVSQVNSPDDLTLISTVGSYDPATGIAVVGGDLSTSPFYYVNIGVPAATYPLRDGFYRVRIVLEGIKGNNKFHNFSGCDNITSRQKIKEGQGAIIEFPFYYDSTSSCPDNEDHFVFQIKCNDTADASVKIKDIKLYEVSKI